jgi:hypothetical protein
VRNVQTIFKRRYISKCTTYLLFNRTRSLEIQRQFEIECGGNIFFLIYASFHFMCLCKIQFVWSMTKAFTFKKWCNGRERGGLNIHYKICGWKILLGILILNISGKQCGTNLYNWIFLYWNFILKFIIQFSYAKMFWIFFPNTHKQNPQKILFKNLIFSHSLSLKLYKNPRSFLEMKKMRESVLVVRSNEKNNLSEK